MSSLQLILNRFGNTDCLNFLLKVCVETQYFRLSNVLLIQIKNQFHRAHIVGQRFPICMVHVKGSVIEVGW